MTRFVRTLLHKFSGNMLKEVDAREAVHFLHIGKCAGTQVKLIAEEVNSRPLPLRIIKHKHRVLLDGIPPEARYFFATRDPLTRFRSGFYSRKRRGRPVFDFAWSSGEELAFARFEHANDLAEALFSGGESGRTAFYAMRSIRHAAQNQVDWFARAGDLFVSRPPVWILRQEHFGRDLAVLSARLGLDLNAIMANQLGERGAAHANEYVGTPDLSPLARTNLERWYTQDVEFYKMCEWWIADQLAGEAAAGIPEG